MNVSLVEISSNISFFIFASYLELSRCEYQN